MSSLLKEKLKEYFGHAEFKPGQENIIRHLRDGKSALVVMATGGGKSLCYQLPALLMPGTALIISPLISLMKNQVDVLRNLNIEAHFLNSTLRAAERRDLQKSLSLGDIKLLYVAPETLFNEENLSLLKSVKISFVAVDEAHCISEWGHDFRPEYGRIQELLDCIEEPIPVIALTATATPKVREDIRKSLGMDEEKEFVSTFNRENLFYEVLPKVDPVRSLLSILDRTENKGASGIVYCNTRRHVTRVTDLIKRYHIKAVPYHAGLSKRERAQYQEDFLNKKIDVVVATVAFGMGIDKPDLRFVVHYDVPKSIETYYQEAGRAGRDGKPSTCTLLFADRDLVKVERLVQRGSSAIYHEANRRLLRKLREYAKGGFCRRQYLLDYFGEPQHKGCGNCDNCHNPPPRVEVRDQMLYFLQNLEGSALSKNPISYHLLSSDEKKQAWLIPHARILGLLGEDAESLNLILSSAGKDFLKNPPSSLLLPSQRGADKVSLVSPKDSGEDVKKKELFNLLKDLRDEMARQKKIPPYVIFRDHLLREMADRCLVSEEHLLELQGVGRGKVEKFGRVFLKRIQTYTKDNGPRWTEPIPSYPRTKKAKFKNEIIQKIDYKVPLNDIRDELNLSLEELIAELEQICDSGIQIDIKYELCGRLGERDQEELEKFFRETPEDNVENAIKKLGRKGYPDEEVRLARISFISQFGN
ncbi:MAG: RecQ family ATP-dependent DNA helicase [Cytophagales bacterium]|nr:RecQ family ATP-dependent DNA helicase [Cytophagales bacterium]